MGKIKTIIKKYYKHILITLVIACLLVSGIVVNGISINNNNISYDNLSNKEITIDVEIIGEVKYPGKYTVKLGTKIKEILYIAGGLNKDSDTSLVNLNSTLENNDVIVINKSTNNKKRLNINTATEEELASLKAIGSVLAAKIVVYRKTKGSFKTIYDLKNVNGISENIIIKIIDDITLS